MNEQIIYILMGGSILFYPLYSDIKERKIYILPAIVIGILSMLLRSISGMEDVLFGCAGILPGLFVLLISRFTKESIGMGDGLILMCYGLCEGFTGSLGVWILALFFSSLFSIICMISRKLQRKSEIPFTPFMFLAFLGVTLL